MTHKLTKQVLTSWFETTPAAVYKHVNDSDTCPGLKTISK